MIIISNMYFSTKYFSKPQVQCIYELITSWQDFNIYNMNLYLQILYLNTYKKRYKCACLCSRLKIFRVRFDIGEFAIRDLFGKFQFHKYDERCGMAHSWIIEYMTYLGCDLLTCKLDT